MKIIETPPSPFKKGEPPHPLMKETKRDGEQSKETRVIRDSDFSGKGVKSSTTDVWFSGNYD